MLRVDELTAAFKKKEQRIVRGKRRLAKKLDVFLTRSRDAVVNLESELPAVLQRLGLDRKLKEKATADCAGVGPVRSLHHSE
ncbi:hypothetical protein AXG93_2891s1140 [Marchantia polymorpha subsp. ruderalis]|uniref:Uncharacterized protein n=1 Tax=Marchantia polymorpha subsp. ruderalis TaxID=1480154 RepID=A0A176WLQ2_MARPO|nr:hypothetical protein AXG93_2891s1140 [Marchantia polymorpha subsp. ruderalis]